ncbi:MAG: HAD hydrolase-like protein, partial [Pseudomonadota bacterium]
RRLAALGTDVPDSAILAIGDGVRTDVRGGMGEDFDTLFITGGLAAAETKTHGQPDPGALKTYLDREQIAPTFSIGHLR